MARARQFWGRVRMFVTKRGSKPNANLIPVKLENTQIRIELKLQSGYGKTCRHGSLHPRATSTRKRKVNRLYFGEQRDAAPNCHYQRSSPERASSTPQV